MSSEGGEEAAVRMDAGDEEAVVEEKVTKEGQEAETSVEPEKAEEPEAEVETSVEPEKAEEPEAEVEMEAEPEKAEEAEAEVDKETPPRSEAAEKKEEGEEENEKEEGGEAKPEEEAPQPASSDAETQEVGKEEEEEGESLEDRVFKEVREFVGSSDVDKLNMKDIKARLVAVFGKAVYKAMKDSIKQWATEELQRIVNAKNSGDEDEDEGDEYEAEGEDNEEGGDDAGDDEDYDEDDDDGKKRRNKKDKSKKKKKKKRRLKRSSDSESESSDGEGARAAKRRKKHPVKRALTAYILFSGEKRRELKQENPDLTFGEVGTMLGNAWKALPDDERDEWKKRAEEDKARYEREFAEWQERNPEEAAAMARKSSSSSSSRKRKANAAASGGGAAAGDEEEEDEKPLGVFDQAVKRVRRGANRRQKEEDIELDPIKEAASLLVARMHHAAAQDEDAVRAGRPATHKIAMVGEVARQCNKRNIVQEMLLDAGLLKAFKEWLTPSAHGALPNKRLRETVYDVVERMHIDLYYLDQSEGLGRALMSMRANPRETEANRQRLSALMERWARDIFQVATKYRGLADHEGADAAVIAQRKKAIQEAKATPFAEQRYTKRARIPEPAAFDYAVRPSERAEATVSEDPSLARARQRIVARANPSGKKAGILKRVKLRGRSKHSNAQAHSVNIEGH